VLIPLCAPHRIDACPRNVTATIKSMGKKDWTREIEVMKGSQVNLHAVFVQHPERLRGFHAIKRLRRQARVSPSLAQIVIEFRHPKNFQQNHQQHNSCGGDDDQQRKRSPNLLPR